MTRQWNEILMDDHAATEKLFDAMDREFAKPAGPARDAVAKMIDYVATYLDGCHNRKEELHLFPLVERLGIPRHGGPLAVMLMEHEQARGQLAELKSLAAAYIGGDTSCLPALAQVWRGYTALLKNHFWKENDILYPMALRLMSPQDGQAVVKGIEAVEAELGADTRARYHAVAEGLARASDLKDLSFDVERSVLAAILNTLPVELSFVDAEDTVRYFSHENKDKIFPRNRGAIGTKVQNCHPPRSLHKVNRILADFKAGKRDVAEFWIDFKGMKVHIRYFPVHDEAGKYIGCLETVQDVTAIQKLEGQRRLLDEA